LAPASADASWLKLSDESWRFDPVYTAAPGEANHVVAAYTETTPAVHTGNPYAIAQQLDITDGSSILIEPAFSPLPDTDVLSNCTLTPGHAQCRQPVEAIADVRRRSVAWFNYEIILGDGDDSVEARSRGLQVLVGGPGNDSMVGGNGRTEFHGGTGADQMWGGGGEDWIYYWHEPGDVQVSLDNAANDGTSGERDNVHGDIEDVQTDAGDDTITAGPRDNLIYAGGGNDSITGGAGADELYGDTGDDTIDAVDGTRDVVYCGDGSDTVLADAVDDVRAASYPYGCEHVTIASPTP